MSRWTVARIAALAALLLFACFFAGLAIDVMARVWKWRAQLDRPVDVVFLLYMESVRVIVTVAGVVIAVIAARRGPCGATALAFGVGFTTILYTKWIAFAGFPGEFQSRMAVWLLERGVSRAWLAVFFGHPEWSVWPALAGFLLFAARYPRSLTADDVTLSGARDRPGALRSVALAGVDVGAFARTLAVRCVRNDWIRGRVIWPAAIAIAIAHTLFVRLLGAPLVVHGFAIAFGLVPGAVLVALMRAGYMAAEPGTRTPLLWLRRGTLAGLVLFAAAAAMTQFMPALPIGAITLAIAPAAVAVCWLIAVLHLPRHESAAAVAFSA